MDEAAVKQDGYVQCSYPPKLYVGGEFGRIAMNRTHSTAAVRLGRASPPAQSEAARMARQTTRAPQAVIVVLMEVASYTARAALPLQGALGRYATTRVLRLDPRLA